MGEMSVTAPKASGPKSSLPEIPGAAICRDPEVSNLPLIHEGLMGRINEFILDRRVILGFWAALTIATAVVIFVLVYRLWKILIKHHLTKTELLKERGSVSNRVFDPRDDNYPTEESKSKKEREFPSSFSLKGYLRRSENKDDIMRSIRMDASERDEKK